MKTAPILALLLFTASVKAVAQRPRPRQARRIAQDNGYAYQYVFALDAGHCDGPLHEQTLSEALQWVWQGYKPGRHEGAGL